MRDPTLADYLTGALEKEIKQGRTELQAKLRIVFTTGFGPEALTWILQLCNWGSANDLPGQIIGTALLVNMGILGFDGTAARVDQDVIDALLNVKPKGGTK
jgi:hypothetical protein